MKKHTVSQKDLLRKIKCLKVSELEKAEILKIAEFIFEKINEK